jgi:hypothetical protein
VRYLAVSVHAGIGAPGAHQGEGFGGDAPERPLDHLLDGAQRALRLPPCKIRPIVLDADGDSDHRGRTS